MFFERRRGSVDDVSSLQGLLALSQKVRMFMFEKIYLSSDSKALVKEINFRKVGSTAGWFVHYGFESALYLWVMGKSVPVLFVDIEGREFTNQDLEEGVLVSKCDYLLGECFLSLGINVEGEAGHARSSSGTADRSSKVPRNRYS